jgi:hypothetical protein
VDFRGGVAHCVSMRAFLVAAVFVLSSCGLATQGLVSDGETAQETTTTVTGGPHNGWLLFPGAVEGELCGGSGFAPGLEMPCGEILNVCVRSADGYLSPKWVLGTNGCSSGSPVALDVCRVTAPELLAFYGYTVEECEVLLGG